MVISTTTSTWSAASLRLSGAMDKATLGKAAKAVLQICLLYVRKKTSTTTPRPMCTTNVESRLRTRQSAISSAPSLTLCGMTTGIPILRVTRTVRQLLLIHCEPSLTFLQFSCAQSSAHHQPARSKSPRSPKRRERRQLVSRQTLSCLDVPCLAVTSRASVSLDMLSWFTVRKHLSHPSIGNNSLL
jgi:hypothetical protein